MSIYFRYSDSLASVLARFNVLTRSFGVPRVTLSGSSQDSLLDFYRLCTHFAMRSGVPWTTKMHINEIGIIVLFQAPGVVLKIHHDPGKQYSYLDIRLRPSLSPRIWSTFSLNLYNDLRTPTERGWLFRRLRKHPPAWYIPVRRSWLPSFYRPAATCVLPLNA